MIILIYYKVIVASMEKDDSLEEKIERQVKYSIRLADGSEVKVLRVAWFPQRIEDYMCLPYSLKMVLEYFIDVYPNVHVRRDTPNLKVDELVTISNTKKFLGFRGKDEKLIENLNTEIKTLKFQLMTCEDGIEPLKNQYNKNLPSIIFYNPTYIYIAEKGDRHAAVFVGYLNEKAVILNNSYYGSNHSFSLNDFIPAWELENFKAILITPIKLLGTHLEEFGEVST